MLQGFAAFRLALFRIPPRHSQTTRATNCANPGFLGIQFCTRCGQTCGQTVFLTISACGGSACIAGVSRDCGHSVSRLEGGATRTQITCATNCATPGYSVLNYYTTVKAKIKVFPVCGHLCGQSGFSVRFCQMRKSRKSPCSKGLCGLSGTVADEVRLAPKAGALPTALHPVI